MFSANAFYVWALGDKVTMQFFHPRQDERTFLSACFQIKEDTGWYIYFVLLLKAKYTIT